MINILKGFLLSILTDSSLPVTVARPARVHNVVIRSLIYTIFLDIISNYPLALDYPVCWRSVLEISTIKYPAKLISTFIAIRASFIPRHPHECLPQATPLPIKRIQIT